MTAGASPPQPAAPPARLIVLEAGLGAIDVHQWTILRGIRRDAPSCGFAPELAVSARTPEPLAQALGARRLFRHLTYDRLSDDPVSWRIDDLMTGGAAFGDDLQEGVGAPDDAVVLVPTAWLREILGLALWCEAGARPRAVALCIHDAFGLPAEPAPGTLVAALLRHATNRLRRALPVGSALLVYATNAPLAAALAAASNHAVAVMPHPGWYDLDPAPEPPPREAGRVHVAVLGGARQEKGFDLVPAIVGRAYARDRRLHFLVQAQLRARGLVLDPAWSELEAEGAAEVSRVPLDDGAYRAWLALADLILLPYEAAHYRARASGVFADAVAAGKPVVVSDGTTMADHLRAEEATGLVVRRHAPDAFADAVLHAAANLPALASAAQQRSAAWRSLQSGPRFLARLARDLQAPPVAAGRSGAPPG